MIAAILIAIATSALAQERIDDRRTAIDVHGSLRPVVKGLVVELHSDSRLPYRGEVDNRGDFRVDMVPPGYYELHVADVYGNVVWSSRVRVAAGMSPLTITLPEYKSSEPGSGVVAVERLRHKIPPKAHKQFKAAIRELENNNVDKAIEHLKEAIRIDPEYMEAYNNLGARYLSMKQYDLALEQFRKAVELDRNSPVPCTNVALTLLSMGKPVEAEAAARRAIAVDPGNQLARYFLALALLKQNKSIPEAVGELRRVVDEFPIAHSLLGQALFIQGDVDGAESEFEAYLATPHPQYRQEVERWLAQLRARRESARAAVTAAKPQDGDPMPHPRTRP